MGTSNFRNGDTGDEKLSARDHLLPDLRVSRFGPGVGFGCRYPIVADQIRRLDFVAGVQGLVDGILGYDPATATDLVRHVLTYAAASRPKP